MDHESEGRLISPGLYFSHPACLEHDPRVHSPMHPDTPERLIALERALAERDWLGWERREAPAASVEQLELVHSERHVRSIMDLCAAGGGAIDPDTFVGEESFRAALHAAGGACEMTRALLAGEARVGFCAVRPSGHHAERERAMGFCLFDNVAVAAASAIADLGLRRVFVLDWDVHHGNGTGEIFRDRSDVLFASIHQQGLFPGTGRLDDVGSGPGEGYTINLPVPAGSREPLWLALMERVILPVAVAFEPELVLVSAGFDAHVEDPLADCALETGSFPEMAMRVRDMALTAGIPLGVVLEGGYNRRVLAECVCATLPALAGEGQPSAAAFEPASDDPGSLVERAVATLARHWPL
ncbi:MAG TPA: histone deacetylase [Solirubrobacteraceae bacterium]|nr:histone deacetylase [Solirubrobacteraceae bacterium]